MPTLSEIQNTVIRCLKNGNIAMTTPDDITIGIIPMDYTACDVLSCIEHHALNCNENEIIIGIFHNITKELLFIKVGGVVIDKKKIPEKKISYSITSW